MTRDMLRIMAQENLMCSSRLRRFYLVSCVFVLHVHWKLSLFLGKTVRTPKWVVDFLWERHIPKKSRKSSRILRMTRKHC